MISSIESLWKEAETPPSPEEGGEDQVDDANRGI